VGVFVVIDRRGGLGYAAARHRWMRLDLPRARVGPNLYDSRIGDPRVVYSPPISGWCIPGPSYQFNELYLVYQESTLKTGREYTILTTSEIMVPLCTLD